MKRNFRSPSLLEINKVFSPFPSPFSLYSFLLLPFTLKCNSLTLSEVLFAVRLRAKEWGAALFLFYLSDSPCATDIQFFCSFLLHWRNIFFSGKMTAGSFFSPPTATCNFLLFGRWYFHRFSPQQAREASHLLVLSTCLSYVLHLPTLFSFLFFFGPR